MFRFALGSVLLSASVCAAQAPDTLPPFQGRSGATKEKTVRVCTIPDRATAEGAGWVIELAVRIKDAVGPKILEKRLRALAESWSGSGLKELEERKRALDELIRDLPPKYRELVRDYFRQLERVKEKK